MTGPLQAFRFTRPAIFPGRPKPPIVPAAPPVHVGIDHRRGPDEQMEMLEETIATMQRGEPLLYRNRWNRETGQPERVESPCYWARVESMWQNTRYYPLFDADDNVIEGQYAFDEGDLPMPLEELHALWTAWFTSRGF